MIKVEVITPEKITHLTEGVEIIIPTTEGIIGVRKGHIPLITPLSTGEIIIKKENGESEFLAVSGGYIEVLPDSIKIMADNADLADVLNEEAVLAAIEEAQKIKARDVDAIEMARAASLIELNLARLKSIQRKKRHRSETVI